MAITKMGAKKVVRVVDGGEHGPLILTVTDRTFSLRFYRTRKEYVDTFGGALVRMVMKEAANQAAEKRKARKARRRRHRSGK